MQRRFLTLLASQLLHSTHRKKMLVKLENFVMLTEQNMCAPSCADSLGMAPMAMSSPLRTAGSGDLGMARNISFSNLGNFGDFDNLGSNTDHSMLQVRRLYSLFLPPQVPYFISEHVPF